MLGQKQGEDILEHFAVLHKYYRLSILSNFTFLVRCFFSNLPSDSEGHIMLVEFMYVANIGKRTIKGVLLNVLLALKVNVNYSLNMILCIEDDGDVKPVATGKQI